jgi:hypothetical protein
LIAVGLAESGGQEGKQIIAASYCRDSIALLGVKYVVDPAKNSSEALAAFEDRIHKKLLPGRSKPFGLGSIK